MKRGTPSDSSAEDDDAESRPRQRRRRNPPPPSPPSPSSSEEEEGPRRQRFARLPVGVALGLHPGQGWIDEPRIRKRRSRQPHDDGYLRNEKGEIVDKDGVVIPEGELASTEPFQPSYHDEVYERQKILANNPDYLFAQLMATLLNKSIDALWDMDNMENARRAERNFEASQRQAMAVSQRNVADLLKDVEASRNAFNVFQQEENLIRSGIVDPINVWLTTHHLDDWLSVKRWLMPFYMRWQYRWMGDVLLTVGHKFGVDSDEDVDNLKIIMDTDALLYTRTDSLPASAAQLIDTLSDSAGMKKFIRFVRTRGTQQDQLAAGRMLTFLVYHYFLLRDIYAQQFGWRGPNGYKFTGLWLRDVIVRAAHATFSHLPALGDTLHDALDALPTPLSVQDILDMDPGKPPHRLFRYYNSDYEAVRNTYPLQPPVANAGWLTFPDNLKIWGAAAAGTSPRQLLIEAVLSEVRRILAAPNPSADPTFKFGVDTTALFNGPPDSWMGFFKPGVLPVPDLAVRRSWFPWREDYDLACKMLEKLAAPVVLAALESLFPSRLNDPGAKFALMDMPRSIPDASIEVYRAKAPDARQFYFRNEPATGSVGETLAIGDLVDYYHYNLPALISPGPNFTEYDDLYGNQQDAIRGGTLARYDVANWTPADPQAPPEARALLSRTQVMTKRVLPMLEGTPLNAALTMARELSRRVTGGVFQPFILRSIAPVPVTAPPTKPAAPAPNMVELAVQAIFTAALAEGKPLATSSSSLPADWLAENAPVALLPYHLDEIRAIYSAAAGGRVARGKQLATTLANLEATVAQHSAQRATAASQLATQSDVHGTLIRTQQQLYLPSYAGTSRLAAQGRQFFTPHFLGLIGLAHTELKTKFGAAGDIPLEHLTNPTTHAQLTTAFGRFMAARDSMIDIGHPHTYKTQLDHASVPGRYQAALQELRLAIAEYHRGHTGRRTGLYFL